MSEQKKGHCGDKAEHKHADADDAPIPLLLGSDGLPVMVSTDWADGHLAVELRVNEYANGKKYNRRQDRRQ
ncbi:hypothetical protein GCM10023336_54930 [Streptomyces similanensis]|uniref:Transposase n=1 Tax=Streptomyces similanensis TaxID=1274988 RepID=A0ABP9L6T6_9ACTN